MGSRGPIPKRDEERERRNTAGEDGLTTEKYEVDGVVEIPVAYFFNTYINDIWLALKKSVNVKFFEPTDWAYAKFVLKMIDDQLGDGDKFKIPSGQMMMVLDGMMSKLLLTEADRRRLKIESERNTKRDSNGKVVSAAQRFEQRFEAQREA